MKADWIKAVEAGYRLGGSDEDWLDSLLACVSPLIDHGVPPIAWIHRHSPTTYRIVDFAGSVGPLFRSWIRFAHSFGDPRLLDLVYRSGRTLGTACEDVFPVLPGEHTKFRSVTAGRVSDLLQAGGHTGTGVSVAFAAYSKSRIKLRPGESKRWRQLGAHLGAGLRLRELGRTLSTDEPDVEAVLDPDGHLQDARGKGDKSDARAALRMAVRRMDRARRAASRFATDDALDSWEALVAGRWSLVEHFDTDGRRFVVAVHNDPIHCDPRGLTLRERQVAEYVGMGHSTGQIAYTLGISASSVTDCSARAQRKLGLSSRPELAAFFAETGPRARLAEVVIRADKLLIGSYPLIPEGRVKALTGGERDVLADLLGGSTNADIARRRKSSERTVANQIQSIYRKLGVRSRSELAAHLHNAA